MEEETKDSSTLSSARGQELTREEGRQARSEGGEGGTHSSRKSKRKRLLKAKVSVFIRESVSKQWGQKKKKGERARLLLAG